MRRWAVTLSILRGAMLGGAILGGAMLGAAGAAAQVPTGDSAGPSGAQLFRSQCATCHSLNAGEQRQGPSLAHVVGRKIGSIEGYKYTQGYREAGESGQVWDEERLDKYLTNPAAMFPGSTMVYKQPKAPIRQTIIAYLKEQG